PCGKGYRSSRQTRQLGKKSWEERMKLFGRPLSSSATASTFAVGGVLMARPFQIRRLGHFGLTFRHLDEAVRFYADLLGFWVSEQCDVAELAPTLVKPMLKAVKDRTIYMLR